MKSIQLLKLFIGFCLITCILIGCGGKDTQIIQKVTPYDTVTPTIGETDDSITAILQSSDDAEDDQNAYPPPETVDDTQLLDGKESSSDPYPMPDSIDDAETPYPGPGEANQNQDIGTSGDAYPPPGNNQSSSPTQSIAINPIQSPLPTATTSNNGTPQPTKTVIVRTDLVASNPADVDLSSGKYQLVEFFAFWCPVCKSMAPIMNGLAEKYNGRMIFTFLNIDDPENKQFKEVLGYRYQPHFFLLDENGVVLNQWVGYVPVEDFDAVLIPLFP